MARFILAEDAKDFLEREGAIYEIEEVENFISKLRNVVYGMSELSDTQKREFVSKSKDYNYIAKAVNLCAKRYEEASASVQQIKKSMSVLPEGSAKRNALGEKLRAASGKMSYYATRYVPFKKEYERLDPEIQKINRIVENRNRSNDKGSPNKKR